MLLDRAERDEQPVGDRLVRATLGDQLHHLALARRQLGERVVRGTPADELADDLRVERRAALGDALDGGGELVDVGDAILEQVADALAAREELGRVAGLDVLREHEHAGVGVALADLARRAQALVGVRRRHLDVDDRDVGPVQPDVAEQVLGRSRL